MVLCLNKCDAELLMAKNAPHSARNLALLVSSLPRRKGCVDETRGIMHVRVCSEGLFRRGAAVDIGPRPCRIPLVKSLAAHSFGRERRGVNLQIGITTRRNSTV